MSNQQNDIYNEAKEEARLENKKNSFEDFLREKHSDQYVGLDDDMCDDESDWICNLDGDELITYADSYGRKMFLAGMQWARKTIKS
jgi:hypothetical protein